MDGWVTPASTFATGWRASRVDSICVAQRDGVTLDVLDGVAVRYGSVLAVDDVDLVVPPGSLLALTGPSGARKSSLLWTIAGAVRPVVGEVTVAGARVSDRTTAVRAGV